MWYPRWFIHQVSTNYNIPEMIHGIGMRRLRDLQESGGVSSWTIPVQSIILHSFSLYEFTFQVLIKVFNEVVSTWDHMSYFLFSPPGFLGKYTRHIYCPLNSMDLIHIELTETIIIICCIIFSLLFPLGFKGVLTTYQIQFSSHFSQRVFGGDNQTSYVILSPPGFLKEVYKAYLLFSKLTYGVFLSKVFSYELSKRQ